MKTLFAIAAGGSVGALARYYLSKVLADVPGIPWATLVINLLGALIIGFCGNLFTKTAVTAETRALITTGFLGAFTTFSTFAWENLILLRNGSVKTALINIAVSNAGGIMLALAGFYAAELLFKPRG